MASGFLGSFKDLKGKKLDKKLDELWSYAVKLRAGFKSELSGKTEGLNSHHILGKSTHRLRWDIDNGICITNGEHKFIAHGSQSRSVKFLDWAMARLPMSVADKLRMILRMKKLKVDKVAVLLYLKKKIEQGERVKQVPLSRILAEDKAKTALRKAELRKAEPGPDYF